MSAILIIRSPSNYRRKAIKGGSEMNCNETKEKIIKVFPSLFECQQVNDYLKLSTSYLYPDGDYIDLYLVEQPPATLYVTDLGETMGYLADHGINLRQSPKRQKIVDDIRLTQGVELFRGELRAVLDDWDKAGWVIERLAQAITQISSLVLTLRLGSLVTFKEDVEEFWIEAGIPYELDYRMVGGSGQSYTLDFYLPSPNRPWLIKTLSSQSKGYANILVSQTIRTWHDLLRVDGRYQYLSLLDDSTDTWQPEWINQLGEFSEVITWSNRDELASKFG
jgi:hypothetical protein